MLSLLSEAKDISDAYELASRCSSNMTSLLCLSSSLSFLAYENESRRTQEDTTCLSQGPDAKRTTDPHNGI